MKIRVSQLRRMVREEARRQPRTRHRVNESPRRSFYQSTEFEKMCDLLAKFCQSAGADPIDCIEEFKVEIEAMLAHNEFYDTSGIRRQP